MSTLIAQTTKPNFQKVLFNKNKASLQWLFKWMGYSSLAATIISIIVYWYKKQNQQRPRITTSNDKLFSNSNSQQLNDEDVLHMNPRKKLHISTSSNSMMRRSSSSLSNLSNFNNERRSSLITPPPSPQSSSSILSPRSISPRSWSSRFVDGVISATRKKKRMTISLKNVCIRAITYNNKMITNALLFRLYCGTLAETSTRQIMRFTKIQYYY